MRRRVTLALVGALTACGPGRPSEPWLPAQAGAMRCTLAGRDRMPPVLMELPVPETPTGLLARAMDPMALDGLGFERDAVVCAVMIAPDVGQPKAIRDSTDALAGVIETATNAAIRAGGRCVCESARAAGVRELLGLCAGASTDRDCVGDDAVEVEAAVAPLREAIAATRLPRRHWRLVGRSDRPGWLADHLSELIERHPGGSTILLRGEAVPSRGNHELVRGLLREPGVVAVVRQDSGRALLVARELDGELVLDHFALPELSARFDHLAPALDDAALAEVVAALERPALTRAPLLDPREGNLVEIDRVQLELVDAAASAAVAIGGPEPPAADPARPPVLVDRVGIQAPFGARGEALRVRMVLSEAGVAWASALVDAPMPAGADAMGLADPRALAVVPEGGGLVLHDRAVERVLVDGIHRLPEVVAAIEAAFPGKVSGTTSAWRIDLGGDFGGLPPEELRLEGVREQLTSRPHRIEVGLDAAHGSLMIDAR